MMQASEEMELVEAMLTNAYRLEELLWSKHSIQAVRLGTIVQEGLSSLREQLQRNDLPSSGSTNLSESEKGPE